MMGQAHALKTIGNNVANVNTGGYKRNDNHFSSILSKTLSQQSNLGGIKVKEYQRISQQGRLSISGTGTDVAINGDGYFIVKATGGPGGATETLYTRDGSFQVTAGSAVSATAEDGSTIQVQQGFLSDKSGNRVQGFAPDPGTGIFPATGSLSDLRVDQFANNSRFEATTTALLDLNLPAGNVTGVKQIDLLTLGGSVETGDKFSVTINDATVSHTVAAVDTTLDAVRNALITALNANATTSAAVTAAANPISGALNLTGKFAGTAFTASTTTTNVAGGNADNSITSNTLETATTAGIQTFGIEVFDSTGKQQTATLNFTKTANNMWDLSATTSQDGVAQIDTMTIAGAVEAGDVFTATVNGTNASYTVTGAEASIDIIRDNLITEINSNSTIYSKVTAAAGTIGEITLTAATAGTAFTSGASTTQGVASVAQIDTMTIAGTVEVGDVFTVDVNGTNASYTVTGAEASIDIIRNNLVTNINANSTINSKVTAAAGASGKITLTAVTAGTAFTSGASTTQGVASVAQVGTVTISGAVDQGDVVRATINGTNVDYSVTAADASLANIAAGLITAINANAAVNSNVTASNGAGGVVTITSDAAGVTFTLLASTPTDPSADTSATPATVTANVTALTDNTASVVNTTANVAGLTDNTASVANTTANKVPTVTTERTGLIFDTAGKITTPTTKSVTLPLTFAGGGTATVALDIGGLTQFAGPLLSINYEKNGFGSSLMTSFNIGSEGQVVGSFQNNTTRVLYKIPLARFTNPDGLDRRNGNTFALSRISGDVTVQIAGSGGTGTMMGNTVELSNVTLPDEFSKLIITQNAYNSSATVFRTVDEMMTVARDLKN